MAFHVFVLIERKQNNTEICKVLNPNTYSTSLYRRLEMLLKVTNSLSEVCMSTSLKNLFVVSHISPPGYNNNFSDMLKLQD